MMPMRHLSKESGRVVLGAVAAFLVAGGAAACGGSSSSSSPSSSSTSSAAASAPSAGDPQATVFAAASLTKVFPQINPGAKYTFGGSGALEVQIEQGAPADVFAAA